MTYAEFINECSKRTIDERIAMANDKVKEALRNLNNDEVRRLLDTEF